MDFSAMTTAFTMKGMKVTFTLRCSSTSLFTFSRSANMAVTSAWSMAVTWAALVWASIMCFAVVLLIPRSGTLSTQPYRSNFGAVLMCGVSTLEDESLAFLTSSSVTRPFGPVPAVVEMSTPRSLASLRTAGVACTAVDVLASVTLAVEETFTSSIGSSPTTE